MVVTRSTKTAPTTLPREKVTPKGKTSKLSSLKAKSKGLANTDEPKLTQEVYNAMAARIAELEGMCPYDKHSFSADFNGSGCGCLCC